MEFIEHWEGRKHKVYLDSVGKPTIGVGFNLARSNAERSLRQAGIQRRPNEIFILDDRSINRLFAQDVSEAINACRKSIDKFDNHAPIVKLICVDLMYNIGETKFNKFVLFKKALYVFDYSWASRELFDSKWYSQTGRRAKNHVKTLDYLGRN